MQTNNQNTTFASGNAGQDGQPPVNCPFKTNSSTSSTSKILAQFDKMVQQQPLIKKLTASQQDIIKLSIPALRKKMIRFENRVLSDVENTKTADVNKYVQSGILANYSLVVKSVPDKAQTRQSGYVFMHHVNGICLLVFKDLVASKDQIRDKAYSMVFPKVVPFKTDYYRSMFKTMLSIGYNVGITDLEALQNPEKSVYQMGFYKLRTLATQGLFVAYEAKDGVNYIDNKRIKVNQEGRDPKLFTEDFKKCISCFETVAFKGGNIEYDLLKTTNKRMINLSHSQFQQDVICIPIIPESTKDFSAREALELGAHNPLYETAAFARFGLDQRAAMIKKLNAGYLFPDDEVYTDPQLFADAINMCIGDLTLSEHSSETSSIIIVDEKGKEVEVLEQENQVKEVLKNTVETCSDLKKVYDNFIEGKAGLNDIETVFTSAVSIVSTLMTCKKLYLKVKDTIQAGIDKVFSWFEALSKKVKGVKFFAWISETICEPFATACVWIFNGIKAVFVKFYETVLKIAELGASGAKGLFKLMGRLTSDILDKVKSCLYPQSYKCKNKTLKELLETAEQELEVAAEVNLPPKEDEEEEQVDLTKLKACGILKKRNMNFDEELQANDTQAMKAHCFDIVMQITGYKAIVLTKDTDDETACKTLISPDVTSKTGNIIWAKCKASRSDTYLRARACENLVEQKSPLQELAQLVYSDVAIMVTGIPKFRGVYTEVKSVIDLDDKMGFDQTHPLKIYQQEVPEHYWTYHNKDFLINKRASNSVSLYTVEPNGFAVNLKTRMALSDFVLPTSSDVDLRALTNDDWITYEYSKNMYTISPPGEGDDCVLLAAALSIAYHTQPWRAFTYYQLCAPIKQFIYKKGYIPNGTELNQFQAFRNHLRQEMQAILGVKNLIKLSGIETKELLCKLDVPIRTNEEFGTNPGAYLWLEGNVAHAFARVSHLEATNTSKLLPVITESRTDLNTMSHRFMQNDANGIYTLLSYFMREGFGWQLLCDTGNGLKRMAACQGQLKEVALLIIPEKNTDVTCETFEKALLESTLKNLDNFTDSEQLLTSLAAQILEKSLDASILGAKSDSDDINMSFDSGVMKALVDNNDDKKTSVTSKSTKKEAKWDFSDLTNITLQSNLHAQLKKVDKYICHKNGIGAVPIADYYIVLTILKLLENDPNIRLSAAMYQQFPILDNLKDALLGQKTVYGVFEEEDIQDNDFYMLRVEVPEFHGDSLIYFKNCPPMQVRQGIARSPLGTLTKLISFDSYKNVMEYGCDKRAKLPHSYLTSGTRTVLGDGVAIHTIYCSAKQIIGGDLMAQPILALLGQATPSQLFNTVFNDQRPATYNQDLIHPLVIEACTSFLGWKSARTKWRTDTVEACHDLMAYIATNTDNLIQHCALAPVYIEVMMTRNNRDSTPISRNFDPASTTVINLLQKYLFGRHFDFIDSVTQNVQSYTMFRTRRDVQVTFGAIRPVEWIINQARKRKHLLPSTIRALPQITGIYFLFWLCLFTILSAAWGILALCQGTITSMFYAITTWKGPYHVAVDLLLGVTHYALFFYTVLTLLSESSLWLLYYLISNNQEKGSWMKQIVYGALGVDRKILEQPQCAFKPLHPTKIEELQQYAIGKVKTVKTNNITGKKTVRIEENKFNFDTTLKSIKIHEKYEGDVIKMVNELCLKPISIAMPTQVITPDPLTAPSLPIMATHDDLSTIWAILGRFCKPVNKGDPKIQAELKPYIEQINEELITDMKRAMIMEPIDLEEMKRTFLRDCKYPKEYAEALEEFSEYPKLSHTMEVMCKSFEKAKKDWSKMKPRIIEYKKIKTRAVNAWVMYVFLYYYKRTGIGKANYTSGMNNAEWADKKTHLLRQLDGPFSVMFMDSANHDAHVNEWMHSTIMLPILIGVLPILLPMLGYSGAHYQNAYESCTKLTVTIRFYQQPKDSHVQHRGSKRVVLLELVTIDKTRSGDTTLTSFGNSDMQIVLMNAIGRSCGLTEVQWTKRGQLLVDQSGDDNNTAIVESHFSKYLRQIVRCFVPWRLAAQAIEQGEVKIETYFIHHDGKQERMPALGWGVNYQSGVGLNVDSIGISRGPNSGLDFLSKVGNMSRVDTTMVRDPIKTVVTGALSAKIGPKMSIPELNTMVTEQLEAWGSGFLPIANLIKYRKLHYPHTRVTQDKRDKFYFDNKHGVRMNTEIRHPECLGFMTKLSEAYRRMDAGYVAPNEIGTQHHRHDVYEYKIKTGRVQLNE